MATHKSAEKRHRQSLKLRARNREARSALRSATKTVQTAISSGDADATKVTLRTATKMLSKAAGRGIVHKKNASRRISRLHKQAAKSAKAK